MGTAIFLKRLWAGEYSLPTTFWGLYIGVSFASLLALMMLLALLQKFAFSGSGPVIALTIAILWPYQIVAMTGVWRSAGKSVMSPIWPTKLWGILARTFIVLILAQVVLVLVTGGAMRLVEAIAHR
jgi:hypothetical protein